MAGHKSCEIIHRQRPSHEGKFPVASETTKAGVPDQRDDLHLTPPYGHERVRVERPDYKVGPLTTPCQTGIYHLQQWDDNLRELSQISRRSKMDDSSRL